MKCRSQPRWYHGTSTNAELDVGDHLEPSYGQFESNVWATSSRKHAETFARNRSAIDDGEPVVFEVCIEEHADVVTRQEYDRDELEKLADDGVDAVIIHEGEDGNPELAILTASSAFLCHEVAIDDGDE